MAHALQERSRRRCAALLLSTCACLRSLLRSVTVPSDGLDRCANCSASICTRDLPCRGASPSCIIVQASSSSGARVQEVFGEDRVGLCTGDISVNNTAPVLVMTTEILRNHTYRMQLDDYGKNADDQLRDGLDSVGMTVLDEVHYLGHPERGSVWEELIINLPPHIRALAMSATVANAEEIGQWISKVHGPCVTLQTSWRPVPLEWWFAWDDRNRQPGAHPAAGTQHRVCYQCCVLPCGTGGAVCTACVWCRRLRVLTGSRQHVLSLQGNTEQCLRAMQAWYQASQGWALTPRRS